MTRGLFALNTPYPAYGGLEEGIFEVYIPNLPGVTQFEKKDLINGKVNPEKIKDLRKKAVDELSTRLDCAGLIRNGARCSVVGTDIKGDGLVVTINCPHISEAYNGMCEDELKEYGDGLWTYFQKIIGGFDSIRSFVKKMI